MLADWTAASGLQDASDDELKAKIDQERRQTQSLRDPFTPLFKLTCQDRLARNERVVWEDDKAMALVDFGDAGSTLLVIPKTQANFLTDLSAGETAHLVTIAAATCDSLIVAAGEQIDPQKPCRMYVNPLGAIGVKQLHVHVEAQTALRSPVDDEYRKRTAKHLRNLVGGSGCF